VRVQGGERRRFRAGRIWLGGVGGQAGVVRGEDRGLAPPAIQVDGGIDPASAPVCAAAGASVFVAGSSVFRWAPGIAANMAALRDALQSDG